MKPIEEIIVACSYCHKIKDKEKNKWIENEELYKIMYEKNQISHGICPEDYIKAMKEIK